MPVRLQPPREQERALAVMSMTLIRAVASENKVFTSVRILLQALLNLTHNAWKAAVHIGMAGGKPYPHIARYDNHRRSNTSTTSADASRATYASTRIHRRLLRSTSIFRPAGNRRIGRSSSDLAFELSPPGTVAAHRRKIWRDPLRACRRKVNTTLAATPLRPAISVTFALGADVFLDDPHPDILRPAPPLQPAQNLDPRRPMTLKARLKATRFARYHASDKTTLVGCLLLQSGYFRCGKNTLLPFSSPLMPQDQLIREHR